MPTAPGHWTPPPELRPPPARRASSAARGYGHAHRQARKRVFAEQAGMCGWCQEQFCTDLHHIDGDAANRARANLVGLCEGCHHGRAHGGR